jgi:hypothetical protein
MADSTDRTPADEEASTPTPDWCHWHGGEATTAVIVRAIERPSGAAPYPLSACLACRELHRLIPLTEATSPTERAS